MVSKIFLCLFLLFFCTIRAQINFTSLPCSNRNPKIVGGFEAERQELPFIVSLRRRGGHFCGGSIIHERWILTAGHCVCTGLNKIIKPTQIDGVIGLHNITEHQLLQNTNFDSALSNSNQPITVQFMTVFAHPKYRCEKVKNDIALLKLREPISFTSHIQPCCLGIIARENELATVSGWGWTNENQENGIRSNTLQKATVKIWNNDICEKSYTLHSKANNFISGTQVCAGYEAGGIDSCWADSGGPLITNEHMLIGIVSTGIGCGRPGLPGIYTRVGAYVDWIQSVIMQYN